MKYETVLEVTREELYDVILTSLLEDVRQVVPTIQEDDLYDGYQYEKVLNGMMKQQALVKVTIEKLHKNEEYAVSFESLKGLTRFRYTLEDDSKGVKVNYEEDFTSTAKMIQLNYNLVSKFYKKKSRKKLEAMFTQMEKYILDRRELCQD